MITVQVIFVSLAPPHIATHQTVPLSYNNGRGLVVAKVARHVPEVLHHGVGAQVDIESRGLHSSTFQLNLSRF